MPDVPQSLANRAAKVMERHFRQHRVSRASELPEEARVRLYRDLRTLFDSENELQSAEETARQYDFGYAPAEQPGLRGFWRRLRRAMGDF